MGKAVIHRLLLIFFSLLIISCQEKTANPNRNLTIEKFSDWKTKSYSLNSHSIKDYISTFCYSDSCYSSADYRTRSYYLNGGVFLWIDRHGIDERADSLLVFLRSVVQMGFSKKAFYVRDIYNDMNRVRNLDFDDGDNDINKVMARLEYHLTRAYMRYATGQRFGFVDPYRVFNTLDVLESDSLGNPVSYRKLFDVSMQRPGKKFYRLALTQIYNDNICGFLHEVQPRDSLYYVLRRELNRNVSREDRMRLLCNIERRRWRVSQHPENKYVLVNIPSFQLRAVDADTVFEMRIGCGKMSTKTPLLSSYIQRMDINPKWNVPMSIVRKDIIENHVGDCGFYERKNMVIVEKRTGKRISPERVTAQMLLSGQYRVQQLGGEGNSLGRIIFRFPNNFSVFLHDTSSREVFGRDYRGVSHGCVRVERPLDLAIFLLSDKDSFLIDKMRITMGLQPHSDKGMKLVEAGNTDLLESLNVSPSVPLFITYYTIYPDEKGFLKKYPDIYGYDKVISKYIKPYLN